MTLSAKDKDCLNAADNAADMLVAGVDEAGRGPLAGPVVTAAVIPDPARPIGSAKVQHVATEASRARPCLA